MTYIKDPPAKFPRNLWNQDADISRLTRLSWPLKVLHRGSCGTAVKAHDEHLSENGQTCILSFCSNDRLLFITLIPVRNGGKCPFEDSITAERERGVSLWQPQIEWAICRTNWCLKSLQDLIGLKEEPGNGWCMYQWSPGPSWAPPLSLNRCCYAWEELCAKINAKGEKRKLILIFWL